MGAGWCVGGDLHREGNLSGCSGQFELGSFGLGRQPEESYLSRPQKTTWLLYLPNDPCLLPLLYGRRLGGEFDEWLGHAKRDEAAGHQHLPIAPPLCLRNQHRCQGHLPLAKGCIRIGRKRIHALRCVGGDLHP